MWISHTLILPFLSVSFVFGLQIDFVAHDDIPYASEDCEDLYKPLKDAGM